MNNVRGMTYLEGLVLFAVKVVNSGVGVATVPVTLDCAEVLEGLAEGLELRGDGSHVCVSWCGAGGGDDFEEKESEKKGKNESRRYGKGRFFLGEEGGCDSWVVVGRRKRRSECGLK